MATADAEHREQTAHTGLGPVSEALAGDVIMVIAHWRRSWSSSGAGVVIVTSDAAALRGWFAPERPGPLIHAHVAATGNGRVLVDQATNPRLVIA